QVESLDVRGRVLRLGPLLDQVLSRHAYPKAVSILLSEAIVLTAMLGSALKFDGHFILQTQSGGPVDMLVGDFESPDTLRACAPDDVGRVEAALMEGNASPGELIGRGHLAMTIDQSPAVQRYQGVVPLDGGSLEDAARAYFLQSEQIPTVVRLGVAES